MAKYRVLYSVGTFLFAFIAFNADRQGVKTSQKLLLTLPDDTSDSEIAALASDLDEAAFEAAEEEAWLDVFEQEMMEEEEQSEEIEADDEQNSGDEQNSAHGSHEEQNSADGSHDEQNSAEGSHADGHVQNDGHVQKLQSSAPGHETVTKQEDEQLEQDHGERASAERQTETKQSDADAAPAGVHSLSAEFSCHDGEKTVDLPPIPRFIIVGAQKAGTSALYHLLGMVPGILPSKKFEPHFWDFKVPSGAATASPEERCRIRQRYAKYWDEAESRKDGVVAFEKTPSLLALSKVPPNIKAVMAPYVPKIVVVLRNPIVRAYSHYKMSWQRSGARRATFPSFEEIVQEEVAEMRRRGFRIPQFNATTNDWTKSKKFKGAKQRSTSSIKKFLGYLLRGCYSRQLQFWMREFELGTQLKVVHYESMDRNKSAALQDLLSFVGAPPHNLTDETLDKDYGPTKFPIKTTKKTTDTSSQQRRRKRRRLTASTSTPRKSLKAPLPMGDEVQRYLKKFYKPYNKELVNLLGDEWRGVWQ